MDAPSFIGIDVSKDALDIAALPGGEAWRTANDPPGIDALVARLAALRPALVVLEATGRYEAACAAALAAEGVPVAVVNPRQVRDFAKATGRLAKTDAPRAPACSRCSPSGSARSPAPSPTRTPGRWRRSWPADGSWSRC